MIGNRVGQMKRWNRTGCDCGCECQCECGVLFYCFIVAAMYNAPHDCVRPTGRAENEDEVAVAAAVSVRAQYIQSHLHTANASYRNCARVGLILNCSSTPVTADTKQRITGGRYLCTYHHIC